MRNAKHIDSDWLCDVALGSFQAQHTLASITLVPWVVTVGYETSTRNGSGLLHVRYHTETHVVQAKQTEHVDGADFVPAGARLARCDAFPASRFDDMREDTRRRYVKEYKQYLLWRKAHALSKSVSLMKPGVDYDAQRIDELIDLWIKRGVTG